MVEKSRLTPPDTLTRNYQFKGFTSATDAGRGRKKLDLAGLDALSARQRQRFAPA